MRFEDVGSLSPAGDLLAFSIALILTMGILISIDPARSDTGSDHGMDDLMSIHDSDLLDSDRDGYLEFPVDEINGSCPDITLNGDIIITMEDGDIRIFFLIIDGCITFDDRDIEITSPVRSITVVYEREGEFTVGILSVAEIEVIG